MIFRFVRTTLIIAVLTGALMELLLRSLPSLPLSLGRVGTHLSHYRSQFYENVYWERIFLAAFEKTGAISGDQRGDKALRIPHPTRGWTTRPNMSVEIGGNRFTTNAQGIRAAKRLGSDPDRFTIMVVGDSLSFGAEVGDGVAWPDRLQDKDSRFNVVNLSVAGYGIDQMTITLVEEAARFKPDLVILAFISDDLNRSLLDFFAFRKPRFELLDGTLVKRNSPVGSIEEIAHELRNHKTGGLGLNSSVLYRTAKGFYHYNGPMFGAIPARRRLFAVNAHIIEQAAQAAKNAGSGLLVVHLPIDREIVFGFSASAGDKFLAKISASSGISTLSLRTRFLARKGISRGHYRAPGHDLAAGEIYPKILELPAWHAWLKLHPAD